VVNGPFKPIKIVEGETFPKEFSQWTPDENKRAHYDVRAKNIISSALTLDEFYRVSVCESAKEMWDILEVTHEGTDRVKRARKNTLIQEYEMFRMKVGESTEYQDLEELKQDMAAQSHCNFRIQRPH